MYAFPSPRIFALCMDYLHIVRTFWKVHTTWSALPLSFGLCSTVEYVQCLPVSFMLDLLPSTCLDPSLVPSSGRAFTSLYLWPLRLKNNLTRCKSLVPYFLSLSILQDVAPVFSTTKYCCLENGCQSDFHCSWLPKEFFPYIWNSIILLRYVQ